MSRDVIFGIFALIITLIFQVGLLNSPSKTFDVGGLSSVAFPQGVLVVIYVLAIVQIVLGLKKCDKDALVVFKNIDKTRYKVPACSLGIFILYIFLINILGFYTSTFIYVLSTALFLAKKLNRKFIVNALFVSIGTTAIIYLVFNVWLQLLLPSGLLI